MPYDPGRGLNGYVQTVIDVDLANLFGTIDQQ